MVSVTKKLATKYRVELAVFAALMLRFASVVSKPGNLTNSFILMPYLTSYRFGFSSRFLIGSIIRLFTDFVSVRLIWCIAVVACVVMTGLIALLVGKVVRFLDGDIKIALLALVAVYLFSPFATQFREGSTFGRMEMYHQILMLIMLCCVNHKVFRWFIPFLAVICVAIHQIFVFLYFAPLLVILLFNVIKESKNRASHIALLTLTFGVVSATFCIFQFGTQVNVDLQTMYNDIQSSTNAEFATAPLRWEYYSNMKEMLEWYILSSEHYGIFDLSLKMFFGLLIFSPVILIFALFWRNCSRSTGNTKISNVYKLAALSPFAAVPAFCLTVDYGRWFGALFFMQFALITHFIAINAPGARNTLIQLYNKYVVRYKVVFVALLLYLATLGNLSETGINRIVQMAVMVIKKAVSLLFPY